MFSYFLFANSSICHLFIQNSILKTNIYHKFHQSEINIHSVIELDKKYKDKGNTIIL